MNNMSVKFYGTRGSTPVSGPESVRYGGNTTSFRIKSECLPPGWALVMDTGSGFVPLSRDLLKEGIKKIAVVYSHWHHDHTMGALLAAHTFIPDTQIKIWGPKEHGTGPQEVFESIMSQPLFPVEFAKVRHRIGCIPLQHIGTQVLVIHPKAGFHLMEIDRYRKYVYPNKKLPLGDSSYAVEECLVVFMYKTEHPEYSVSYRFQEYPTGRVCVILTDHENTASLPGELLLHVKGANLLIQDGQYSDAVYKARTGGFGHGTPEYCADVMKAAGAEKLGLTHHDPSATDTDIDARVNEAKVRATEIGIANAEERIFGCADYAEVEV